jgi:hypothetical protein
MIERIGWLADRFCLPLGIAMWMLYDGWGQANIAYALVVPVFLLFLRMYLSYRERPVCSVLEPYKPFQRTINRWHNCEVVGLFLLMWFEAVIAIAAEARSMRGALIAFGLLFVPYALLIGFARTKLLTARAMVIRSREWLSDA